MQVGFLDKSAPATYAGLFPAPVGWHNATTLWGSVVIRLIASSCPVRHLSNLAGSPHDAGDGITAAVSSRASQSRVAHMLDHHSTVLHSNTQDPLECNHYAFSLCVPAQL